jgi:hypothetical protein
VVSFLVSAVNDFRCASPFDRLPPRRRNPDAADTDQLGASLDHLMSYRYEPGANQTDQHPICEAVGEHQRFGGATLVDEQL